MDVKERLAELGPLIRARRRERELGLRAAAEESKVSASTLSRLESGGATSMPDAETLAKLAAWLDISISSLLSEDKSNRKRNSPELSTPEQVEVHLRADRNLSPQVTETLAKMFRLLYDQFVDIERQQPQEDEH